MSDRERIRRRADVRPSLRVDDDPDSALSDEIEHHLDEARRRHEAAGLSHDEAVVRAREEFGDVSRTRRELAADSRRGRTVGGVRAHADALVQDLGFAVRSLRRRPVFSAIALLSLAVGIGGVSATATLVQQVLLEPLPLDRPELVVRAVTVTPSGTANFGPGHLRAWRGSMPGVAAVGGAVSFPAALTRVGPPVRLTGARVTSDYFEAIGVVPSVGRTFTSSEHDLGGGRVVLLSDRVWTSSFAGDPSIVGSSIQLNGESWTVVGIMPGELDALAPTEFDVTDGVSALVAPDFFVPLQLSAGQWENFGGGWLSSFVRLTDANAGADVEVRLEGAIGDAGARNDDGTQTDVRLLPVTESFTQAVRRPLWIMLGAAFAVLVLCCLNLANLLLAQGANRRREMAVRSSLGAGQQRLVRQLVTESVVLGALGGLGGWVIARGILAALPAVVPAGAMPASSLEASAVNWLACACLALVTGFGFGLVPALRSGRVELATELRSAGSVDRGGALGVRAPLIFAEVALAMILLAGAGLMLRSSYLIASESRGFDGDVLTAQVTLPWAAYPSVPEAIDALETMTSALVREPSVASASFSSRVPLAGNSFGANVAVAGSDFAVAPIVQAALRIASPGHVETLSMTLDDGRSFEPRDDRSDVRAVMVNGALAASLRLAHPVGTRLSLDLNDFTAADGTPMEFEVIGVIRDVRDNGVRADPSPELYFTPSGVPSGPWDWIGRELVLSVRGSSGVPPAAELREALGAVAPEIPLYNLKTLGERDAETVALERLTTVLLGAIGALAVLLSVAGIYGVVSYVVAGRTREIGLRMALGSSSHGTLVMIVRQTMVPVVAGVVVGVAGAVGAGLTLSGLLYRTSVADPLAILVAVLIVTGSALAAIWVPARAAARIDPTRALTAD